MLFKKINNFQLPHIIKLQKVWLVLYIPVTIILFSPYIFLLSSSQTDILTTLFFVIYSLMYCGLLLMICDIFYFRLILGDQDIKLRSISPFLIYYFIRAGVSPLKQFRTFSIPYTDIKRLERRTHPRSYNMDIYIFLKEGSIYPCHTLIIPEVQIKKSDMNYLLNIICAKNPTVSRRNISFYS